MWHPNTPSPSLLLSPALMVRSTLGMMGAQQFHIIEDHLEDFFDEFKTSFKNKTDQTMESTH